MKIHHDGSLNLRTGILRFRECPGQGIVSDPSEHFHADLTQKHRFRAATVAVAVAVAVAFESAFDVDLR
jgi:hypothetical protein